MNADQLGEYIIAYEKDGELHVWTDVPDGPYCVIHSDPTYLASYEAEGKKPPCCLKETLTYDEIYRVGNDAYDYLHVTHRDDGPAVIHPNGRCEWYWRGDECDSQEEYEEARDNDSDSYSDYGSGTGDTGRSYGIYAIRDWQTESR